MQNIFSKVLLLVFLVLSQVIFSQSPEAINYQAVARDLGGLPLVNTSVGLTFEIRQGSSTGTAVYKETHSAMTNAFGLFTAEIGNGTPDVSSGPFSGINWGSGSYYLYVEVNGDPMGATQLLSVPYALYSKESANGPQGLPGQNSLMNSTAEPAGLNCVNGGYFIESGLDGNNNGVLDAVEVQVSYYICNGVDGVNGTNGTNGIDGVGIDSTVHNMDGTLTIYYSNSTSYTTNDLTGPAGTSGTTYYPGNGIIFSNDTIINNGDADADPTNELQTLSISPTNDTIFLNNGGGFVPLPNASGDTDWTQGAGVIYNTSDFVGIGTNTPTSRLTIDNANATDLEFVGANNSDINAPGQLNIEAGTVTFISSGFETHFWNNGNTRMSVVGNGNVGIGTITPGANLEVIGRTKTDSITISDGAVAGAVLTATDAFGNAEWQLPSASSDTDWVQAPGIIYNLNDNIGIGVSNPTSPITIATQSTTDEIKFVGPWTNDADIKAPNTLNIRAGSTLIRMDSLSNNIMLSANSVNAGTDLMVTNRIYADSITLGGGAFSGAILTSDGSGNASWGSVSGDNWGTDTVTTLGSNILGNGTTANPIQVIDNDTSATNELQVLSISNDTIFLSNGGFVQLPSSIDKNGIYSGSDTLIAPTTVYQNANTLTFSGGGMNSTAIFSNGGFLGTSVNIEHTGAQGTGIKFIGSTATTPVNYGYVGGGTNGLGLGGGANSTNLTITTAGNVGINGLPNGGGKFVVNHTATSTEPTMHLRETTGNLNRIKLSNNTIANKYWEVGAQTSANDAFAGWSVNYYDGATYRSHIISYGNGDLAIGHGILAANNSLLDVFGTTTLHDSLTIRTVHGNAYTFPVADGINPGDVLTTDAAGNTYWAAPVSSSFWTQNGDTLHPTAINSKIGLGTTTPSSNFQIGSNLHLDSISGPGGFNYNIYTNNLLFNGSNWVRTNSGTGIASYMGGYEYGVELYGNGASGSNATTPLARIHIDSNRARIETVKDGLTIYANTDTLLYLENNTGGNPTILYNTQGVLTGLRASTSPISDVVFSLPNTYGNPGEVMSTDGSGNMSWIAPASGALWSSSAPDIYFNTGRVGIGTASPAQLLTLSTPTSTTLRMERSNAAAFDWELNADNLGFHLKGGADNTGAGLTDFLNVDGLGKVGIGITTPTQLLHLYNGTLRIDDGVKPYNLPSSDGIANYVMQTDGSGNLSWVDPSTFSSASFWNGSAGAIYPSTLTDNVGIGTATPNVNLHVYGTNPSLWIQDSQTNSLAYPSIELGNTSAGSFNSLASISIPGSGDYLQIGANDAIRFLTNFTERMIIANNGYVGIGTPSVLSKFHVVGNDPGHVVRIENSNNTGSSSIAFASDVASEQFYIGFGNPGYSSPFKGLSYLNSNVDLVFAVQNSERMRINQAGHIGIGMKSPNYLFHIQDSTASAGTILMQVEDMFAIPVFMVNNDRKVEINGNLKINDGTQALNRVLTTDAAGNASWADISSINPPVWKQSGTGIIYNAGKVGVGMQVANHLFHIQDSSAAVGATLLRVESSIGSIALDANNNGNVGIGTNASVTRKLHIAGGGLKITESGLSNLDLYKSGSEYLLELDNTPFAIAANGGSTGFRIDDGNASFYLPVQIQDGTEAEGRVLTSDVNGYAKWSDPIVFKGRFSPFGLLTINNTPQVIGGTINYSGAIDYNTSPGGFGGSQTVSNMKFRAPLKGYYQINGSIYVQINASQRVIVEIYNLTTSTVIASTIEENQSGSNKLATIDLSSIALVDLSEDIVLRVYGPNGTNGSIQTSAVYNKFEVNLIR